MTITGFYDMNLEQQEAFRHALHRLLYEGTLQQILPEDREAYALISHMREAVNEYFYFCEIQLLVDDENGIIYTDPVGSPRSIVTLDTQDELLILLIMREELQLHAASAGASFHQITVGELADRYYDRRKRRLAQINRQRILRKFKRVKLIDVRGPVDSQDTSLLLLPALFLVTPDKIEQMAAVVEKFLANKKGGNGNGDADSELA